jgi:hypothetical protein
MPWNAITTADVLSEFNGSERSLLESVQADTTDLQAILDRTIGAARGAVLAGSGKVGATGTIADQLAPMVVAIARWRWLVSIPKSEQMQSAERKKLHDDAEQYLKDVAKGDIKVEFPDVALVVSTPENAVQVASVNPRLSTRDKLSGI